MYLQHIKNLNNFTTDNKTPFEIDSQCISWIRDEYIDFLTQFKTLILDGGVLKFHDSITHFDTRSTALDQIAKHAFETGLSNRYMHESYGVRPSAQKAPLCLVDRSIASLMGILSFGQHLNGFVNTENGMKMWIAKRSLTKGYFAGKLDHLVAGGLPEGISLEENLRKECYEEAGISKAIADRAKAVGVVRYKYEYRLGGHEDILYCYDLSLPQDFTPICTDGEVEEFYLMDIEEVAEIVKTDLDAFKPNCNLVIIDFLIRHGILTHNEKDYLEIVLGLR